MSSSKETDPLLAQKASVDDVPTGTKWTIYMLMTLFGLASLLPWNMVITATGYFSAKFADTNSTTIEEGFPSYFQIGGIASNVAVSLSSIVLYKYLPIKPVLISCNIVSLTVFVAMTVMAKMSTETWPMGFFAASIILFCVACCMSAAYTSGMMAVASMILPATVKAYFLGQGTAGLLSTVLAIITLSFPHTDPLKAGFYYFLIASVLLAIALVAYILFTRMDYVKKCTMRSQEIGRIRASSNTSSNSTISANPGQPDLSTHEVFMRTVKFNLTSFTTLLITLACFPAALSALRSSNINNSSSPWKQIYFQPVMTFLVFNIGDVMGRMTSGMMSFPSQKWILPISLLRLVFIPLIYMCNLQPRSIPVWFTSDIWPGVFSVFLSFTNGHILSLAASYCPEQVTKSSEKSLAGSYSAFSSALGLVVGSLLVFPLLRIIK